jgi:hypothetical protein
MTIQTINTETGEILNEVADVVYSDCDPETGMEYTTPSMAKKALMGKPGIEQEALKACRRKSLCFADTQERADFRRITAEILRNDQKSMLIKAWLQYVIKRYAANNAKAGPVWSFPKMIAAMKNANRRDDWINENKEAVLAALKVKIVGERSEEIFE